MSDYFRVNIKIADGGAMRRIKERVRKLGYAGERGATDVSFAMAEYLQQATKQTLESASGGGTIWNESNPKFMPWWKNSYNKPSSTVGNPPVSQSGGLVDSIVVTPTGRGNHNLEVTAPHAIFHEFGGWTSFFGNTIGARPFLVPTLERERKNLTPVAKEAWLAALGGI